MYSEYFKELCGINTEIIGDDKGFISWYLLDKSLHISEFYIKPEYRKSGLVSEAYKLATKLAKEQEKNMITGMVTLTNNNIEHSLGVMIHYGFKLVSAEGGKILLAKEIK